MFKLSITIIIICLYSFQKESIARNLEDFSMTYSDTKIGYNSDTIPVYDSLELQLIEMKDSFFSALQKEQYSDAQLLLHPNGLYFYTLGKIPSNEFSLQTLQTKKGQLMGTYLSGGDGPAGNIIDSTLITTENGIKPKYVSGTYWIDSMLTNFSVAAPSFSNFYHNAAYGNSGNYSSDHAVFDPSFDDDNKPLFDNKPIIVLEIISNTSGYREILMVEFFQDSLNNWKIYAIGNKEWTP